MNAFAIGLRLEGSLVLLICLKGSDMLVFSFNSIWSSQFSPVSLNSVTGDIIAYRVDLGDTERYHLEQLHHRHQQHQQQQQHFVYVCVSRICSTRTVRTSVSCSLQSQTSLSSTLNCTTTESSVYVCSMKSSPTSTRFSAFYYTTTVTFSFTYLNRFSSLIWPVVTYLLNSWFRWLFSYKIILPKW